MHLNRRDPAQKRSRYLWRGAWEREQVTSDQISIRMQQSLPSLFSTPILLSLSLFFSIQTTILQRRRQRRRRTRFRWRPSTGVVEAVEAEAEAEWKRPGHRASPMRIWPLHVLARSRGVPGSVYRRRGASPVGARPRWNCVGHRRTPCV